MQTRPAEHAFNVAAVVASKARGGPGWRLPLIRAQCHVTGPRLGVLSRGDEDRGGKRWRGGPKTTAS